MPEAVVPYEGEYQEIFNTELEEFGGTWVENNPNQKTLAIPFKAFDYQIQTVVPALGVLILKPTKIKVTKRVVKGGKGL